jgi:hypothetical protein
VCELAANRLVDESIRAALDAVVSVPADLLGRGMGRWFVH